MKKLLIAAAAVASIIFTACSNDATNDATGNTATEQKESRDSNAAVAPVETDAPAMPSFTVRDINGNNVNLQSLKGKKVFVNLWASWCPPCRREMPSIEKLARATDTTKVVFVMLSLDDNFDKAKAFMKKQQLTLPIYYPAENLPELFNVQGIPSTFIFDENGKLLQRIDGGDDYNTDAYKKLLK